MDKKPKVIFAPKKVERGAKQPEQHTQRSSSNRSQQSNETGQTNKLQPKLQLRNKGLSFDLQQFQAKSLYSSLPEAGQAQQGEVSNVQLKYEYMDDECAPIDLNAPMRQDKQFNVEFSQNDVNSSSLLPEFSMQRRQSFQTESVRSLSGSLIQFPGILPFQTAIERGSNREVNQLEALEPGAVGRLIRYKSGACEVELGGVKYRVVEAPRDEQVLDVFACDARHGLVQHFAALERLLVCAVDFTGPKSSGI